MILGEQNRFQTAHLALSLICDYTEKLKNNLIGPAEVKSEVEAILSVSGEEYATEELLALEYVCRTIRMVILDYERKHGEIEQMDAAKMADFQSYLYHYAKAVRQEYWLSWLQDIFCCQVETALRRSIAALPAQDTEQRLFVVAFPEFAFTDFYTNQLNAFYKSVAEKFISGTLDHRIQRQGTPLKTLAQLTTAYRSPNREIVIFAGTIMWKNFGKYFNMAPVFFQGACVYAWEKQQISGIDGKSSRVQHRHPVSYGKDADVHPGSPMNMAGTLTVDFLARNGFRKVRPVFSLTIFGRQICFAITICLDLNDGSIIGNEKPDVHILMASGMRPEGHLDHICSEKIFLYCDALSGRTAMYARKDNTLWATHRIRYGWIHIDVTAMAARYDRNSVPDAVPGIYVAPNVEEI